MADPLCVWALATEGDAAPRVPASSRTAEVRLRDRAQSC